MSTITLRQFLIGRRRNQF